MANLTESRLYLENIFRERGYITPEEFEWIKNEDHYAHTNRATGFLDYIHLDLEWKNKHQAAFCHYWQQRVGQGTGRAAA